MNQTTLGWAAATGLAVALRCYLRLERMAPHTGFYQEAGILAPLLALLVAGSFLAVLRGWLSSGKIRPSKLPLQSIPLGAAAILLGLAVEVLGFREAVAVLEEIADQPPRLVPQATAALLALAAGAALLLAGRRFLRGELPQSILQLALPTLWAVAFLSEKFSAATALRTVSGQQLGVVFYMVFLLFLAAQAGFLTQVSPHRFDRAVVLAYLSATLALVLALPELLAAALGSPPVQGGLEGVELLLVLLAGVYGLVFALEMERWAEIPGRGGNLLGILPKPGESPCNGMGNEV